MAKTILQSSKVSAPGGIMSQGVEVPAGKMVFVSGQVARDWDGSVVGVGDVAAQTRKDLSMRLVRGNGTIETSLFQAGLAGHHNYRNIAAAHLALDVATGFDTIETRHNDVHQDKVHRIRRWDPRVRRQVFEGLI